jgi:Lar family restriction alleviation protein
MQAKGLKPCPFCGEKAAVAKGRDWWPVRKWYIVYCKECTAGTGAYSTEQLAKDAWNARSTAKPEAMYVGFNSHDAETRYRCPICEKPFGSWTIYGNMPNKNGTKHYCPHCETELEGLE